MVEVGQTSDLESLLTNVAHGRTSKVGRMMYGWLNASIVVGVMCHSLHVHPQLYARIQSPYDVTGRMSDR